jgi:hypothetical protein
VKTTSKWAQEGVEGPLELISCKGLFMGLINVGVRENRNNQICQIWVLLRKKRMRF